MWDIRPPLKQLHKNCCLERARNYMKIDLEHVLFTDEMHATLDGPDGWSKVWVPKCQQGGGGIIIWAGVVDSELVGPFRIPEGVKMTSATYVEFLKRMFVILI